MAIKTHLADSDSPLKEGSKLLAICGELIPNAAFVFMWDEQAMMSAADMKFSAQTIFGTCRQCRHAELKGRYIYGIRSGEDQKQSSSTE